MQKLKSAISLCLVMTMFVASGLHLVVLQGYAWTNMYKQFNQSLSHKESLSKTFHRHQFCGTCQIVKKLQSQSNLGNELEKWFSSKVNLILISDEIFCNFIKKPIKFLFEFSLLYTSVLILGESPPPKFKF